MSSEGMQVPEDLKIVCPLCGGNGTNTVGGFADHAKEHQISCRMCKGRQWLWALDQEEMAQRIAKVESALALERTKSPIRARELVLDQLRLRDEEILQLREEIAREREQWQTWGVVEIAVRNPNVAEYMKHWEERALKAEANADFLRKSVGAAHMMISRNDLSELDGDWDATDLPPRLKRYIALEREAGERLREALQALLRMTEARLEGELQECPKSGCRDCMRIKKVLDDASAALAAARAAVGETGK